MSYTGKCSTYEDRIGIVDNIADTTLCLFIRYKTIYCLILLLWVIWNKNSNTLKKSVGSVCREPINCFCPSSTLTLLSICYGIAVHTLHKYKILIPMRWDNKGMS